MITSLSHLSFQTMCYLRNGGEGRGELKKKKKKTPRYFSRHQVYLSSYMYFSYKQSIKAELFASSLNIENRYLIPKTTVTEHFFLKKTPLLSSNGQ